MKFLDWDSTFFDKNIYELDWDFPIDLLIIKSSRKINILIEGFIQTFEENKIEFYKELDSNTLAYNDVKNETTSILGQKLSEKDIDTLYHLAYLSGQHSRFKLDRNFSNQHFEALYKRWIDNSLNGHFADEFFIYKKEGKILGFITVSIKDTSGRIGLFAVDTLFHGQGIGILLLKKAESFLMNKQVKSLIIPTQLANEQACAFYSKMGYTITSNIYLKHFWKDDTI